MGHKYLFRMCLCQLDSDTYEKFDVYPTDNGISTVKRLYAKSKLTYPHHTLRLPFQTERQVSVQNIAQRLQKP